MGLDILSIMLIWFAIRLERWKTEDSVSSLDNFGLLVLQIVATSIAFIATKSNPYT